MRTSQTSSQANTVLNQLRETADIVGKPQSVVAANWISSGVTSKPDCPTQNEGITAGEYPRARGIVRRLA